MQNRLALNDLDEHRFNAGQSAPMLLQGGFVPIDLRLKPALGANHLVELAPKIEGGGGKSGYAVFMAADSRLR